MKMVVNFLESNLFESSYYSLNLFILKVFNLLLPAKKKLNGNKKPINNVKRKKILNKSKLALKYWNKQVRSTFLYN